jgi:hypothetical protein
MSGPFDKELEAIANTHTQDFARKLAHEVANLILRKLGIEHGSAPISSPSPSVAPARKKAAVAKAAPVAPAPAAKAAPAKKAAAAAPQKRRASGEDRATVVDKVLRVVTSRDGVAVGDVVKATGLDRGPVAAALKSLKEEGRIHMGGTRRFARYAASQAAADRASEAARKG